MGVLNRVAAVAALLVLAAFGGNASQSMTEAEAKAAALYNLASYVQWPESRAARVPLVIGVLGPDAVFASLAVAQGKPLNGRPIQVRDVRPDDDPALCDVLFVPSTHDRGAAVLRRVGNAPVLTVGDGANSLRDGAAIRLYFERSKLRLEIELTAVERAQLRVSSKVLSLAKVLRNGNVVNTSTGP